MIYREPCGCAHDGAVWKVLCAAHQAEWQERHDRAQKEKARSDLLGWYHSGPIESEVVRSTNKEV
jgi:hypothetical protein